MLKNTVAPLPEESMELFERLAEVTRRQKQEGELPDFVVPLLLQEVEEYETYSNVCCKKIGFSLEDIHRTHDRLGGGY